jgi:hypothetical protein
MRREKPLTLSHHYRNSCRWRMTIKREQLSFL